MNSKGGTVTFDAEDYAKAMDELKAIEKRLRDMGLKGFSGTTTRAPSPASREKTEPDAMELDIDIAEIEWKRSKKAGGGPAGPNDGWAWAFGFTPDGGVRRETMGLVQAIERYGAVRVGDFEITLAGRDGKLLNRKKI